MRKKRIIPLLSTLLWLNVILSSLSKTHANEVSDMFSEGKPYLDVRLRYEGVEQDNPLEDASGLTFRTKLGFKTAEKNGFSAVIELEDSRVVMGVDDYNNTNGMNTDTSVIADPETTELDQGFVRYQSGKFSVKVGRQVLVLDNHRFVGHVGWRQDRQTFDAFSSTYKTSDNLWLKYAYLDQRNRIFAEEKDIESSDHLINIGYKLSTGKLAGYAYLLETDNDTDNRLDTYGISYRGKVGLGEIKVAFGAEYATQVAETGAEKYDADYLAIEAATSLSVLQLKIAYEDLGSDSGLYGFSTPLATLHKFNGWADVFLSTPVYGLTDISFSMSGKMAGGKWSMIYHDFSASESTTLVDDLGSEIDLVYSAKFAKHYNAGIKFASYSAGDDASLKVDTNKLWLWIGASF